MVVHRRRRLPSTSLSVLPEDIVVQIVGRISCIKTILRCTCVCKSWYTFITSTQFVQFHDHDDNIDKRRRRLLMCNCRLLMCKCVDYRFSIHDDSENFHKYYDKSNNRPKCVLEAHACNGLICYMSYDDGLCLYLWNPVIRKVKKLADIDDLGSFKLWFDSNANDYKILNIVTGESVHVYSLNTNSWKLITEDVRVSTDSIDKFVYINGTLYWPAQKDQEWIIVSLDTKSWMFRETATSFKGRYLCLTPSHHDDSLVILRYPDVVDVSEYLSNPNYIDDCVFDVYKYTLNELYSVNIGEDAGRIDVDVGRHFDNGVELRRPLGVRHNYDELLFHDYKTDRIFSYNIKTKKLTEFDSTRIDNHLHRIHQVTPFVETLALLDDKDAYGYDNDRSPEESGEKAVKKTVGAAKGALKMKPKKVDSAKKAKAGASATPTKSAQKTKKRAATPAKVKAKQPKSIKSPAAKKAKKAGA